MQRALPATEPDSEMDVRCSEWKQNKVDIILARRGLAYSAGMNELMLTNNPTREEIEKKLSMLIGQITDRWRDYFGVKARD
jgi:hypothetical protein